MNFPFPANYSDASELNSLELQHIFQTDMHRLILGGRLQNENDQVTNYFNRPFTLGLPSSQSMDSDFTRFTAYGYYQIKLFDQLRLTAGGTFDDMRYPQNSANTPTTDREARRNKLSPKLGIDWTPNNQTRLRAAYTRSAAGLFNTTSTLIEPSEVAGFNQAYRTLTQSSTTPFTEFETWGLGFDHIFPTQTYINAEAQLLNSSSSELLGAVDQTTLGAQTPTNFVHNVTLHERNLYLNLNQLLGDEFSVGASYRLTLARLNSYDHLPNISPAITRLNIRTSEDSTLNQLTLFANYYLPCGFFSRAEVTWWRPIRRRFRRQPGNGSTLWEANIFAGYRFPVATSKSKPASSTSPTRTTTSTPSPTTSTRSAAAPSSPA